jgi:hypothetical protein
VVVVFAGRLWLLPLSPTPEFDSTMMNATTKPISDSGASTRSGLRDRGLIAQRMLTPPGD